MTPELPEILDALESANRLFHGWHFDGLWSEYDESVRQKVQRVLNKLRGMPEHIGMEIQHTAASPPSLDAPAEIKLTRERLQIMELQEMVRIRDETIERLQEKLRSGGVDVI